ncbi:unnamed protein product [Haemonchus placei]|uniref:Uncharacterized protein n=1 Tax=Haemonchus placei TaxID=6290 RepID=A0A0N4VU18_HAEPC|nr:unnamed protein product [Haemonchus placei]
MANEEITFHLEHHKPSHFPFWSPMYCGWQLDVHSFYQRCFSHKQLL